MGKGGLFAGVLLLAASAAGAAPTPPEAHFRQPYAWVGEPLELELSYRHPAREEVIFPDSSARFAGFEYIGRRYYPTRTRRGQSLDRAIYRLRTFSLDSVQVLRLPVRVLRGQDTVVVFSTTTTLRLRYLAPRTVAGPLRQATTLQPTPARFNYPYWLAGAGLLLLLTGGLVVLFRQHLRLRYQRYKLRKNHAYFLAQYARHIERFELSRSVTNMERAITLWKNYLTRLENSHLNTLTTREIEAHYHYEPTVSSALRVADRVIYGNQLEDDSQDTNRAFAMLRAFAEQRYADAARQVQLTEVPA